VEEAEDILRLLILIAQPQIYYALTSFCSRKKGKLLQLSKYKQIIGNEEESYKKVAAVT
jgi:hypothetical protein